MTSASYSARIADAKNLVDENRLVAAASKLATKKPSLAIGIAYAVNWNARALASVNRELYFWRTNRSVNVSTRPDGPPNFSPC